MKKGFIGTYTTGKSKGIYSFELDEDSGKILNQRLFAEISSPKYIFLDEKYLYTICKFEENAGIAIFDFDGNVVDKIGYEKSDSCHIAKFGDYIYTANYHSGEIAKLSFIDGKLEHLKTLELGNGAGAHQVLSDGKLLYIPCLNLDKMYVLDYDLNKKAEMKFPKGSGVRHGVFLRNHELLYLVSELSAEVFTIKTDTLEILNTTEVIEYDKNNAVAAVRLSADEKLLYVSTRGDDSISVFNVSNGIPELFQIKKSGGKHPRDFMIYSDRFLLTVNRDSDNLCVFNLSNGKIEDMVCEVNIPEAISVVIK